MPDPVLDGEDGQVDPTGPGRETLSDPVLDGEDGRETLSDPVRSWMDGGEAISALMFAL